MSKMLLMVAQDISLRGTCERLSVGCVIARDSRIISTGYNGPPAKFPHCSPDLCDCSQPCIRSVHAEANAIAFAAKYGIRIEGCTMYCTDSPCLKCAELIINSGIVRLVYIRRYKDTTGVDLLKKVGLGITQCGE